MAVTQKLNQQWDERDPPPQFSLRCANSYPAAQKQWDDAAVAQGGTQVNMAQEGQHQSSAMGDGSGQNGHCQFLGLPFFQTIDGI